MKKIPFESFPAEEQRFFRNSCRHWGERPDDFRVEAEEGGSITDPANPPWRDVIVVHIPSGRGRRYERVKEWRWIRSFEDDITAIYFTTGWGKVQHVI